MSCLFFFAPNFRSYQKTASIRLTQTFLSAWHELTRQTMSKAVSQFAEKIGLSIEEDSSELQAKPQFRQCSSMEGEEDFSE